jgi:hypothetical protein
MEPLERIIRKQAKRLGIPAASPLVDIWPEVVGDTIAANAWPARVTRKGVLYVNTSSATWAFELTQLASRILARLGEALTDDCPLELRFAVGPVPSRNPASPASSRPLEIDPEELEQAERLTAVIDDEELRSLIARAAAASLARSRSK